MRAFQIQYEKHMLSTYDIVHKDAIVYSPERGWAWLQRLCFWFMGKIGASYLKTKGVQVERVTINPERTIAALIDYVNSLEESFNVRAKEVYMGPSDLEEIMKEIGSLQGLRNGFDFGTEYFHGKTLCGLRVNVVPWMKGILIL